VKKDITAKPEVLGVEKFTADNITLRVTVKTRPGRQWAVQRNLRAQLMPALEEAGFTAK
jgi:small conductance mechanosensitive channel